MPTKFKLVFDRKKQGLTESIIQIRVYQNGKCKYFNSGITIKRKEWDDKNQKINHHHPNYIQLNKYLACKIGELQEFEFATLNKGQNFEIEMFDNLREQSPKQTFNQFIAAELENSPLKQSTINQQKSFLKKLNGYNSTIHLHDLNFEFCTRYELYLKKQGLGQNSIHKEFKNIKKFVNAAINKDLIPDSKNPFKRFKVKTAPTKTTYITEEEIRLIEQLEFKEDSVELETIRDLYLFGVYTGLRYSDLINLKKSDILKDDNGHIKLVIRMQKTSDFVYLPIQKLYAGKPYILLQKHLQQSGDCIFRYYSNQHINRMLKVISRLAGIERRITFHTSRHTFGTYLLNKGLPVEMVQKLMGHRTIQQTLDYAKLLTNSIDKELSKIFANE